jgi:hypothetical protein
MQCGAFVIIVVTACGICGKPGNLAGKDVDLAATKPGYTPRRTQREGCFSRRWHREGSEGKEGYKKGLPSRSKIPPTRPFLCTPRIHTSHLSKAILTTV